MKIIEIDDVDLGSKVTSLVSDKSNFVIHASPSYKHYHSLLNSLESLVAETRIGFLDAIKLSIPLGCIGIVYSDAEYSWHHEVSGDGISIICLLKNNSAMLNS